MRIINRHGEYENVQISKIQDRLSRECEGLDSSIEPVEIAQEVIKKLADGVTTTELDEIAARYCFAKALIHPDFEILAVRILASNLHKNVEWSFSGSIEKLYNIYDEHGTHKPLIGEDVYKWIMENKNILDGAIRRSADFTYSYFGLQTLINNKYLMRIEETVTTPMSEREKQEYIDNHRKEFEFIKGNYEDLGVEFDNVYTPPHPDELSHSKVVSKIVEIPQYMLMRCAVAYHYPNMDKVIRTYNSMADKNYTPPSPTLYNACGPRQQNLSCFLLGTDDSLKELDRTQTNAKQISKWGGGIGIHIGNVRSKGQHIYGTGGKSSGIVPMAIEYDAIVRWINQGGKRLGAIALYLEIWHPDILDFINLKSRHGDIRNKAPNLFLAVMIPDIFMKRLKSGKAWTLIPPNLYPNLYKLTGKDFEREYLKAEQELGDRWGRIDARELNDRIAKARIESGVPYIIYEDHMNYKCNQKNLGKINSSNLCTEITQYSDNDEYACCVLTSMNIPKFYNRSTNGQYEYDFKLLAEKTGEVVENLEEVIDRNVYPVEEAKVSNLKHRPLGIGHSGFANLLNKMRVPYTSKKGREMNRKIASAMYYGALRKSCDLAKEKGKYSTFDTSPMAEGKFQFDLWNERHTGEEWWDNYWTGPDSDWDWEGLRQDILKYGLRHSLLISLMPTASTSQILGNWESFEPCSSNLFTRKVLGGVYVVKNYDMIRHLIEIGCWNEHIREKLKYYDGSLKNFTDDEIPKDVREIYKTVYEISQKSLIDMAAERAPYICQSQSLNLYFYEDSPEDLQNPRHRSLVDRIKLSDAHGWKVGLKTGCYYTRTQKNTSAIKFGTNYREPINDDTDDNNDVSDRKYTEEEIQMCSLKNKDACMACQA